MAEGNNELNQTKAWIFFEKARKTAQSGNYDYAIEMYLEGLHCAPDLVHEGHAPLHELALLRQVKHGKKPSVREKIKYMRGKTPLEQMLNAEYLFAKDPDNLQYAEALLKAAVAGDYTKTAEWIADQVFQANNDAEKPSFQTYIMLKDSYSKIAKFDKAIAACQRASRLKPEDGELADEFKRLSAEQTVAKGKYDRAGDFRDSIKDRQAQEKLLSQDAVIKTKDYRLSALEDARKEFATDPDLPKNIFNLANALVEVESDSSLNEAITLLENAYEKKKDFSFKQRAGLIHIKQLKQKIRAFRAALEANPDNNNARTQLSTLAAQLNTVELEHYRLCVENYPTDLEAKYEYGIRLVRDKQYDQAIPLFQEAQRDPRHKITSMNRIGTCFFKKGWYADSIDVYTQAINAYEINDDSTAKELRYNLALAYENQGDAEKALEILRKIAQLDFGYKDVRKRIDSLRNDKK